MSFPFKNMAKAFALFESIYNQEGDFVNARFSFVNEAFTKQMGVKNTDVLGKTMRDVWPDDKARWDKIFGQVVVTGYRKIYKSFINPTGNAIIALYTALAKAGKTFASFLNPSTKARIWIRQVSQVA